MYLIQDEATYEEFVFSFILYNVACISGLIAFNNKKNSIIPWLLSLLFFLFAFWDTDYFSYKAFFYMPDNEFRDPFYYYLTFICLDSYVLFRFFIWGTALFLFYKTIKRFKLEANTVIFVFIILFLLTFSTGRVCLAMSCYFYGLSFLVKRERHTHLLKGWLIILLSFLAHRSLLLLIVITPLIYLKFNKKKLFLVLCMLPLFVFIIKYGLNFIVTAKDTGAGSLQDLTDSVYAYASIDDFEYNWKFALIKTLHHCSFYFSTVYVLYIAFKSKNQNKIDLYVKKLLLILSLINLIALSFLVADIGIASKMSERYLFMSGIPLCIILSYLSINRYITNRALYVLLFISVMWGEAFYIGKIYSHYL